MAWLSPRLILRHLRAGDLATLLAYRNDPKVARYQSWSGLSEAQARQFIDAMSAAEPGQPGAGFQFAIELSSTGTHIGDCYLKMLDFDPQQAEIGYTLARDYQGQGYGTEAVARLLEYCFDTLDLHRVTATTACANTASIGLLGHLGMRREGRMRRSFWCKGRWLDEYLFAVLRDEWLDRRA